ncbi:HAD-IA family hydrolase [Candidatus Bathyarchaeota archaeon]|nr:HAD-IA family hydrolase [Candidatus Bathyarchaeota archaeon]NIV45170.1 HAD-IA family hydrolase [Candidatus Bathyarchaeota archaeon]
MKIKAAIFDLDGTIADFNLDYKASRAEIIHFLVSEGFPQSLFSLNDNLFEILNKVEIFMKNHRKETQTDKIKASIFSIAEKYEMEAARTTQPIPGIRETLKALRKMKLKLALFTVNGKDSVSHILRTFDLKQYFAATVTRDDVSLVKPNPVHLETALNALGVKPREAVVVGDSVWDMKSARTLNAYAIGTTTGIASRLELTRAGAHCLITSPLDVVTLIEQLNRKATKK